MLRDPALNELQLYVWPAPRMDTSGSYLCAKERVAWISSKQSFDALCTSGVDSQPSSKSISHFGREPKRSVVILSKFITSCPISRWEGTGRLLCSACIIGGGDKTKLAFVNQIIW